MDSEKKETGESTIPIKLNAFFCFVKARRRELEQEKPAVEKTWEELVIQLKSEWEDLPVEDKTKYAREATELAKIMKDNPHPHDKVYDYLYKLEDDNSHFPELTSILKKRNKMISSIWAPPSGQSTPAIVMHINFFVDEHPVYIPAEIAVAAFSLEGGLLDCFSTLVNPGQIPCGHGQDAQKSADTYDIPLQSSNKMTVAYYVKIVDELEAFFKKHEIKGKEEAFIFCPKTMHNKCMNALERLYYNANREFKRNLHFLESLVVTLSLGGLESIANQKATDLHSVIVSVQSLVKLCSTWKKTGESLSLARLLSKSDFTCIDSRNYSELGKRSRVASSYLDHPNAVIGAFLFDQQVTDYLSCMDYAHLTELGCDHHVGESKTGSPGLIYCALSNVKRLVYLTLDVLLVNYRIQPVKGLHYPNTA